MRVFHGYDEGMQKRTTPAHQYARLGARLRELRQKAGRSGPWVIREMERRNPELAVKKSWLYAVETGERRPPFSKLELLCSTIGASVYLEIYEDEGKEQPAMLDPELARHVAILRELDPEGRDIVLKVARLWARLPAPLRGVLKMMVNQWDEQQAEPANSERAPA